jgi:omega-6 fatty acid desaturase (delta-12 desaturase)
MAISEKPAADSSSSRERIRRLTAHCQGYKGADSRQAITQLVITIIPFLALCALMLWQAGRETYGLVLLLSLPAAGLLVRLFIIQHDCGHGSFFPSRRANNIVGRIISILTFTPYDFWLKAHNMHHAGAGNLDRRCIGSIDTITVDEYRSLPPYRRLLYRLYRNPVLLILIGTPLHVIFIQRFLPGQGSVFIETYRSLTVTRAWRSVLLLDLSLIAVYGLMAAITGWQALLAVYFPILVITSWIGGWLFFVQHQFENTYWKNSETWDFHEAAILGSSYYDLPRILHWFTGNIGLHHIHHLCPVIPYYRLQECLKACPELQTMNRLTLAQSLKCINWALWDEKQEKMIGFRGLGTA